MGAVRLLHAWAGAIVSLLLVVLGLTGTLLIFEDDWLRLTAPAARTEAPSDPAALGAAANALQARYGDELRTVVFGGGDIPLHKAYLQNDGYAYATGSGAVVAEWRGNARPEAWVFDLHHYLLAGDAGKIVAGVAGLAGALLVLTGLVIWLPAWRASGWRIWPASGRRRDLVSSHRNLGLITAAPVFVLCLTGGAIVFHEQTGAVLQAFAPPPAETAAPPPAAGEGAVDWTSALAEAQAAFPHARIRTVGLAGEPGRPASVRLRQPSEWHPNGRTVAYVDPATSRVAATIDAQALGAAARAQNAFYPVHAALVGGPLYEVVCALSGLALTLLGVVGVWSFAIKPRGRRNRRAAPAAGVFAPDRTRA